MFGKPGWRKELGLLADLESYSTVKNERAFLFYYFKETHEWLRRTLSAKGIE